MIAEDAKLLRLYVNANDRIGGEPLYAAVVQKARELGIAGASVFTAEIGYGLHRVVYDAMSEYSFFGTPVVVEVIDSADQITRLLSDLQAMISEGLVTLSSVNPVGLACSLDRSE